MTHRQQQDKEKKKVGLIIIITKIINKTLVLNLSKSGRKEV